MNVVHKLEQAVLGRVKDLPHLPPKGQRWLGENIWWIVSIVAVFFAISILFSLSGLLANIELLNEPSNSYFIILPVTPFTIVEGAVNIFFMLVQAVLLTIAIKPLRLQQKKGWVILFVTWLFTAVAIVINAILTLTFGSFLLYVIFGAVVLAAIGYFLFELHGVYAKPSTKPREPVHDAA